MKYAAIIELQLKHLFYADERCPDLAIEPDVATARLLGGHRCLLRQCPGRLRVVTPIDATGHPVLPLPAGVSLIFELRVTNGDFALFTDLSDIGRTPSPTFIDAGIAGGTTGELQLVSRTARDPITGVETPASQSPGVLAEVRIVLSAAIFQVVFRPRLWRWAYYCVTDLAAAGGELSIVDASPSGAVGALSFSEANRTKLDETPDPFDPIAAQIAARNPGLRCVRFLSDQAVACREEPRAALELRLDGERVSSPLSNPSMRSFTRRPPLVPVPPPEDVLFHVIEYRAQPFSRP
jgi:hypothetical protein